jgi:hypothetical protein
MMGIKIWGIGSKRLQKLQVGKLLAYNKLLKRENFKRSFAAKFPLSKALGLKNARFSPYASIKGLFVTNMR